ncbi:YidB family protein [Desulforhopalus sp. 52FAK]
MDDLLQMGAKVFSESNLSGDAGSNLDIGSIVSALSGLTGGQGFDLGSILSNLDAGGLGDIAKSWLGDGGNEGISPEQVTSVLGSDKIADFASQLGLSTDEAVGGLSEALPQIMDQGSSGGSLLDAIGGIEGAIGLAGKLFGK